MDMENKVKISSIQNLVELKKALDNENEVDIAEELEEMGGNAVKAFRLLNKDKAADVFAYLSRDMQEEIVTAITDREISNILDELFLDDAVDFIEEMPANVVKRVLRNVPHEKRDRINQLLQYPEGSAGSIMTIEYVELKEHMTVEETFAQIRKTGLEKETVYTCYVINAERCLVGSVSVLTLLMATPDQKVVDIMDRNIISATTNEDKEGLANDFSKYDLLAMPVVDGENRLVGIVTVDDAFEVHQEEATEDFHIMAAMSPSEEQYLKASVWTLAKNRMPWLLLLMLSATVTGSIIVRFEDALSQIAALVAFIPMLMNTGGNAGSQSSAMVIRGMALEEIELSDVLKVLWKEVRVAVLVGLGLVVVNFARIMLMYDGDWLMSLTVSLSLYATVIMAKTVGCLLPMGAKRLKLDPAVMASPVITTVVDAGALLVYLSLATAILHI